MKRILITLSAGLLLTTANAYEEVGNLHQLALDTIDFLAIEQKQASDYKGISVANPVVHFEQTIYEYFLDSDLETLLPIPAEYITMGGDAGNGGGGYVCRDQENQIFFAQSVDLWEGANLFDLEIEKSNNTPMERQLFLALDKAKSIHPYFAKLTSILVYDIYKRVTKLKAEGIKDTYLAIVPDSLDIERPKSCPDSYARPAYEQIINFTASDRLKLDLEIYESLATETDRAALLLHEAIYKLLRLTQKETDSRSTRKLIAYLFSDASNEETQAVMEAIIEENSFIGEKHLEYIVNRQAAAYLKNCQKEQFDHLMTRPNPIITFNGKVILPEIAAYRLSNLKSCELAPASIMLDTLKHYAAPALIEEFNRTMIRNIIRDKENSHLYPLAISLMDLISSIELCFYDINDLPFQLLELIIKNPKTIFTDLEVDPQGYDNPLLIAAIIHNHSDIVRLLAKYRASQININQKFGPQRMNAIDHAFRQIEIDEPNTHIILETVLNWPGIKIDDNIYKEYFSWISFKSLDIFKIVYSAPSVDLTKTFGSNRNVLHFIAGNYPLSESVEMARFIFAKRPEAQNLISLKNNKDQKAHQLFQSTNDKETRILKDLLKKGRNSQYL